MTDDDVVWSKPHPEMLLESTGTDHVVDTVDELTTLLVNASADPG